MGELEIEATNVMAYAERQYWEVVRASLPVDDRSALVFVTGLESAPRLSEFSQLLDRRLVLVTLAGPVIEDRGDGLAMALSQIVQ